jgi:hypothetical protein
VSVGDFRNRLPQIGTGRADDSAGYARNDLELICVLLSANSYRTEPINAALQEAQHPKSD